MNESIPPSEKLQQRHELLRTFVPQAGYSTTGVSFSYPILPNGEVLYGIPTFVLQALEDVESKPRSAKANPKLLSKEELELEWSFAKLCQRANMIGIFANGPIIFPVLQENASPDISADPMSSPAHINAYRWGTRVVKEFSSQQLAYLGWLTSNPTYQQELDELRRYWLSTHANPTYLKGKNHLKQFHDLPAQAQYTWRLLPEHCNTFLQFYRRWDLEGFATWDLPIQVEPNLGGPGEIGQLKGIGHNPAIQLPGTMKLPTKLKAQLLLDHSPGEHLEPWQSILDNNQTQRLAKAFVIHFYQTVILKQVLGSRLYRHQVMLDDILARVFGTNALIDTESKMNADTIKKIRQWYLRQLNPTKTT